MSNRRKATQLSLTPTLLKGDYTMQIYGTMAA
jgi:hypothetical protein